MNYSEKMFEFIGTERKEVVISMNLDKWNRVKNK